MSESAVAYDGEIKPEQSIERSVRPSRINQIIYLAAALFLLNSLLTYSAETRAVQTLNIGDAMPGFSLNLLDGGRVTESDFIGKPMMYVFYADWCPCSHESVDHFKKAREVNKNSMLNIFFVGIQDSSKNLTHFAEAHALKFPVAVSGGNGLAASAGVKTTPTTIFVDKGGIIRSIYIGKVEKYNQLSEGLNSIIPSATAS